MADHMEHLTLSYLEEKGGGKESLTKFKNYLYIFNLIQNDHNMAERQHECFKM